MPSSRFISLTALGLAVFLGSIAEGADISIKPGDQVIRVNLENEDQLKALLDLRADIWSHEYAVGPLDVHVSPEQRKAIGDLGMKFEVLNPDLMNSYANERAEIMLRSGVGNPFDGYLNLNDTYTVMDNLVAAHPELIEELTPIGNSIESRPLRVWRITGPNKSPKPAIFCIGLQHAREWVSGPVVLYVADRLVNTYGSNPAIANLVDRADFYVMPVANPDGYAYSWIDSFTRLWRKNRRDNGDSTFGVDLNRNWAHGWGGPGSTDVTDDELYRGTAPFSEPETQALSNFITNHSNIRGYMDYHSFGQVAMWPYGEECTTLSEPDYSAFFEVGQMYHKKVFETSGVFYGPGPTCQQLYQASGISVDWVYGTANRMAMTTELRDDGTWEFALPASQILPTCQENFPGFMAQAEWATSGVVILVKDPPAVFEAGSSSPVKFMVYNSAETYVPGSARLYYRFGTSGPYSSVVATALGGVNYSASLPAPPCGSTIEYHVEAQGSGGFLAHAPNAFAVSNPEPTIYSAISVQDVVLDDHFETDLGWTVSVAGATAGQWQRAIPVNDPSYPYDPISDSDGSGLCYVTQNGLGDVNSGTVILTSPTLDLSGGDVRISYDYFLYLSNPFGGFDKLLVQIDSNNGAGPWKQIAVQTTGWSLVWKRVTIDQAALNAAGVTLTSTMKLRFSVNDSNTPSTVEGAIDNVRVSVGTCSSVPCPGILGDMNSSGLVDGDDIQGFVNANINNPFFDPCADLAAPTGVLDEADTAAFVNILAAP